MGVPSIRAGASPDALTCLLINSFSPRVHTRPASHLPNRLSCAQPAVAPGPGRLIDNSPSRRAPKSGRVERCGRGEQPAASPHVYLWRAGQYGSGGGEGRMTLMSGRLARLARALARRGLCNRLCLLMYGCGWTSGWSGMRAVGPRRQAGGVCVWTGAVSVRRGDIPEMRRVLMNPSDTASWYVVPQHHPEITTTVRVRAWGRPIAAMATTASQRLPPALRAPSGHWEAAATSHPAATATPVTTVVTTTWSGGRSVCSTRSVLRSRSRRRRRRSRQPF
eukprot:366572-Chlamydomonas_euryale.AAC.2